MFSLSTGRVLTRGYATPLPMPDDVIDRIRTMARRQKANPGLVFGDRNRMVDPDAHDPDTDSHAEDYDKTDSDYDPDEDDAALDYDIAAPAHPDDDDGSNAGVDDLVNNDIHNDENHVNEYIANDDDDNIDDDDDGNMDEDGHALENDDVHPEDAAAEVENNDQHDLEDPEDAAADVEDNDQHNLEKEMEQRYGPRSERYELRPRKQRNYSHLHTTLAGDTPLSTPQMSMKQGLLKFAEEGVAAVKKELLQLHTRKVMEARAAKELTPTQRKEALGYLMFLKRKRCGKVKARGCADGRPQRAYVAREDAASPTVSTEAVFLTAIVDAQEGRDVAIVDVPGAFMQADMDELVHVRFTGKMVDLLLEIDEEMYRPCVTSERGSKVMYVKLLKALYGTVQAARLF